MQRYIAVSWVQQTNVNLNTQIFLRNEINVGSNDNPVHGFMAKLQGHNSRINQTQEPPSIYQRVCNPLDEIKLGQEGGMIPGWKLQGIIAVTRYGDRGPMVHVRDVDSVDCGGDDNGNKTNSHPKAIL